MAFIQDSLGGVSGGVSQQPDILRFPGQCTSQENMIVDVVEGLRRRGELTTIDILNDDAASKLIDDASYHWFSLLDVEYVARFTATGITVYEMDGTAHAVVLAAGAYGYLTSSYNDIRSAQVGEYNMIAAPDVTVAMDAVSSLEDKDEYVTFHIKDGMAWGARFIISWDGVVRGDYTAPAGDTVDATTSEKISSIYIATELYNDIQAQATTDGWNVVLIDNTIVMRRVHDDYVAASRANLWSIEDSLGGANSDCVIDSVQTLDELPPKSYPGHWVRVSGRESSTIDDFYMKYETSENDLNANGVWKECANPTDVATLDETTMPHALIRVDNGTFYFTPLDGNSYGGSTVDSWEPRKAGDAESNPVPAFVGQTITDLLMVQQRLALVSDDHVNLSKSQGEFNYFDGSALDGVDTDPIQLTTPGERAAHLFAAIEHDQNLLVLGNRRQFAIPLNKALTPSNAALVPTTAYDVDAGCRPTAVGGGMFFAFSDRVRTGIREYRAGDTENIHIADERSANLGTYLPAHLQALHADRQSSTVALLPVAGDALYMYQFLNQNNERVLSSWYKLSFPHITISDMKSIDGHFYIIAQAGNGVGLYKLEKPGDVFLDFQEEAVCDASGECDFNHWAFKDIATTDNIVAIVTTGKYAGVRIEVVDYDNSSGMLELKDSSTFNGETILVGVPYLSTYTPTMPVLRDKNGKAKQLDRLTVNFITATVAKTVGFDVVLHAEYYEDTLQEFTGRFLGSTFVVGGSPPSNRTELISVGHNARSVDVTFNAYKHTDLIIQALEYKGSYTQRGQRM